MKTWIKAYKASTWKTYRAVMFIVYPLVLLTYRFICIAAMILNSGDSEVSPYLTFALLEGFGFLIIFLFETISDIYNFPAGKRSDGWRPQRKQDTQHSCDGHLLCECAYRTGSGE